MWLSLVERCVRDAEVAGSNPVTPIKKEDVPMVHLPFYFTLYNSNLLSLISQTHRSGAEGPRRPVDVMVRTDRVEDETAGVQWTPWFKPTESKTRRRFEPATLISSPSSHTMPATSQYHHNNPLYPLRKSSKHHRFQPSKS